MTGVLVLLYGVLLLFLAAHVKREFLFFQVPLYLVDFSYVGVDLNPMLLGMVYVLPLWIFYLSYTARKNGDVIFDEVSLLFLIAITPLLISVLWSEYKVESLEQVVLFALYLGGFLAMDTAARVHGILYVKKVLKFFLFAALFFMIGNIAFFGFGKELDRYTAFIAPQSFGLAVSIVSVIVLTHSESLKEKALYGGLGGVLIIASGSRMALLVFFLFVLVCEIRKLFSDFFVYAFCLFLGFLAFGFLFFVADVELSGRAFEVVGLLTGETSLESIGTARWRLEMYSGVFSQWQEFSLINQVVGDGLLSASDVVEKGIVPLRDLDPDFMDRKRVVHNEFLRVLYEAGVVGALVFCVAACCYIVRALVNSLVLNNAFYAVSAFVVMVLTATQNTLALSLYGSGFAIVALIFFSAKYRGA